jgi:hypothetical protein
MQLVSHSVKRHEVGETNLTTAFVAHVTKGPKYDEKPVRTR